MSEHVQSLIFLIAILAGLFLSVMAILMPIYVYLIRKDVHAMRVMLARLTVALAPQKPIEQKTNSIPEPIKRAEEKKPEETNTNSKSPEDPSSIEMIVAGIVFTAVVVAAIYGGIILIGKLMWGS